jgi:hypothetical protein
MWPTIKKRKRIEIHCNSYSLDEYQRFSVEKMKQKENAQLMRLMNVKDPNVEIIYVVPYPLSEEVYQYFMDILKLVEIEQPEKRIHIVIPENYVKFKPHLSLAQQLLFSPKALNRVRALIREKSCYIIPGKMGPYDF